MRDLLMLLIPVIVASLTTILFEQFQKGLTLLDKAPAWTKQILVTVLAFGLTKLAALLGVSLSTTGVVDLKPEDFSALLSSGLAFLFHNGAKTKTLAAKLGAVALLVGLAACVPSPAVAMPAPFGVNLSVVADTLKLTVPCTADAPAIKCRITPRATIAGRPVTFGATPDIAAGQSATILATFTAVGGDTLVVNASSAGVYPDGSLQTPRDADSEVRWVTPFDAGAQVRSFTIQITVVRP